MTDAIGFIGLGIMGLPMALNLIGAGHRLVVHARRAESMAPLVQAGAKACESPAAVALQSSIIFTMVGDTPDVEQVILGERGIIDGVQPGALVIDMTTISPAVTRVIAARLHDAEADMLDAPVSGGDIGAINGTLSIMVGGSVQSFERALPLFKALGKNIVHIGDHGAGQVCKACNQIVVTQTIAGVAEALLLAEASGVDGARIREALLGGFAGSRILEVHGQRMLDGNYVPGFKASLHQKDMRIVLETANALGLGLPGAAQTAQYLNALVGEDLGDADSAAIYRILKGMNGRGK